jgi:hypothetical protein
VKFAEQHDILQLGLVSSVRPVQRKRWFVLETGCTQMGFTHPLKKVSAAQTERSFLGFYFLPTVVTDNSLVRRIEIGRTQPAIGREKN